MTKRILATLAVFAFVAIVAWSGNNDLNPINMREDLMYKWTERATRILNNRCLTDVGAVASTSAVNTSAASYTCNGEFLGCSAGSTALSGNAIPKGYYGYFLLEVGSSATIVPYQGRSRTTADLIRGWPEQQDSQAVLCGIQIYAASATFTPGTSSLASSGYTVTFKDFANQPIYMTDIP